MYALGGYKLTKTNKLRRLLKLVSKNEYSDSTCDTGVWGCKGTL